MLPAPFGLVGVRLETGRDTGPSLTFLVNRQIVAAPPTLISLLRDPIIAEIVYSDPSQTATQTVEYFEVFVLYGEPYKVRNKPCDVAQDFTWERDFARFRVDSDDVVTRTLGSFRQMDECES